MPSRRGRAGSIAPAPTGAGGTLRAPMQGSEGRRYAGTMPGCRLARVTEPASGSKHGCEAVPAPAETLPCATGGPAGEVVPHPQRGELEGVGFGDELVGGVWRQHVVCHVSAGHHQGYGFAGDLRVAGLVGCVCARWGLVGGGGGWGRAAERRGREGLLLPAPRWRRPFGQPSHGGQPIMQHASGRGTAAAAPLTVSLKQRELTMHAAQSVSSSPSASCRARSSPVALLNSLRSRGGRSTAGTSTQSLSTGGKGEEAGRPVEGRTRAALSSTPGRRARRSWQPHTAPPPTPRAALPRACRADRRSAGAPAAHATPAADSAAPPAHPLDSSSGSSSPPPVGRAQLA